MPNPLFAPDAVFAWAFLIVLAALMLAASWFDLRYLVIPKQLSIATLIIGAAVNVLRGFWLGSLDLPVWQLGSNGPWLGALDGLWFSLAGFAVGFGIFLVMWLVGTAGGGDVKQFAAVAAWVGPLWTLYLLIGTIFAVAILSGGLLIWRVLTGGMASVTFRSQAHLAGKGKHGGKLKLARGRRLGWAVPATVGMVVVLLWVMRVDLGLQQPKAPERTQTMAGR